MLWLLVDMAIYGGLLCSFHLVLNFKVWDGLLVLELMTGWRVLNFRNPSDRQSLKGATLLHSAICFCENL